MKRALEYLIEDIVELAKAADESGELKRQAYGMDDLGLDPFSDDGAAYMQDTNPFVYTLKIFLNSLELETLQRLQALMYSGRDNDSAVAVKKEFQKRNETKTEILRTIAEKQMNLSVYFGNGLRIAEEHKLNIDRF